MRKDTLSGIVLVGLPVLFFAGILAIMIVFPRVGIGFKDNVFLYVGATVGLYLVCSFPLKKVFLKSWKGAFLMSGIALVFGCLSAGLLTLCITEEACAAYNEVEGITGDGG
jgi:hypothetical protein